jgi:2-hydroxy-3-oxopropionate reductase
MTRENRVAVIGLGNMGLPIANNLVKGGIDVEFWNRSDEAANSAIKAGAKRVSELKDINSRIILTVLPGIDPVKSILDLGLRSALKKGDILVVMGTTSIVSMVELGNELKADGILAVDAPMSGGDIGAQNATMSIMVGADAQTFEILLPVFEKIGKTIRLIGPVGAGQLTKAANQVIVGINMTALAEAITLARRSGLDAKAVFDILSTGLAGSNVMNFGRSKIESEQYIPGGYSKFLYADLNYALEAASNSHTTLPVTTLVASLYKSLMDNGEGDLDIAAITREIERMADK